MNKWIGTGRIVRDPELRRTQSDKSVCNFTMACDRKFKKDGQDSTDFIDCVAWGATGDFVQKYFTKGKMIAVEGSLQMRNWTDDAGAKHYKPEINVDGVEFCGDKGSGGDTTNNMQETKPKTASKPSAKPVVVEKDSESEEELPF